MVDRAHIQRHGIGGRDRDNGLIEGGVDRIDGDRVVRVSGVTRNITDDGQFARAIDQFLGDERRDLLVKIDAVDKDIGLHDLRERTASLGFIDVPLDDVFFGNTSLASEITRAGTTSSKSAHHHYLGVLIVVVGS